MTFRIETLTDLDNPALREANPEIFGLAKLPKCAETPLTAPRTALKPQTGKTVLEKDLQASIVKFLQEQGYKVLIIRRARQQRQGTDSWTTAFGANGKGWPDCFAVNPEAKYKTIALELKTDTGKATPEQVDWLLTLSKCGILTGIVTPATWEQMKLKITEVE